MTPDISVASTLAPRSKGGRPRKAKTSVVSVRIPDHIYDSYIKTALRTDIDVRTILRQVLTFYAPKV